MCTTNMEFLVAYRDIFMLIEEDAKKDYRLGILYPGKEKELLLIEVRTSTIKFLRLSILLI